MCVSLPVRNLPIASSCNRPLSVVVRRASAFLLKHLIRNRLLAFHHTAHGCCLENPYQICLKMLCLYH